MEQKPKLLPVVFTGFGLMYQAARLHAMKNQGKVKPDDYPIKNRAARRRLAKGKKAGED